MPPPPDTPKGSLPNPLPSPAAPSSNFTSATSTQAFSYYCDKTKSYYPIIKECDEGWIAVPMTGPNNVTHYAPLYIPVLEPDTSATAEQVRDHPTVVSLELFGKALVYSFNIDHAFTDHISLGFGAAYWDSSIRWQNYRSTDWIFPFYGNYYFTQKAHRGFLTLGVDWIHVSSPGFDNSSFLNNGAAATLGGGYEYRDDSGFLFRISGILIFGRSVDLSPGVNLGLAF